MSSEPQQDEAEEAEPRFAGNRFSKLPDPIAPELLVESQPQPPRPEPAYDENVDAVRWYGIPL